MALNKIIPLSAQNKILTRYVLTVRNKIQESCWYNVVKHYNSTEGTDVGINSNLFLFMRKNYFPPILKKNQIKLKTYTP